jgi:seryl-tRNA synthetase
MNTIPNCGGDNEPHTCESDEERAIARLTAELDEKHARLVQVADKLHAVEAERDALIVRRDELLASMVKLTRETPYPEEAGNAGVLIAEVGTLRAQLATATRERDEARAERDELRAPLTIKLQSHVESETAEQIAAWLEYPCDCGFVDCASRASLLAAAVRRGDWRLKEHG